MPRATGGNLVVQAKALGYETAAFVSLGTLSADLGFAQAFDTFDDDCNHGWWRFAEQVNEVALPWIATHSQGEDRPPGFLWVHYSDPHRPYGTADNPGQGVQVLVNGTKVASAPTLGLEQSWPIDLRPGPNEVSLLSPHAFEDDRRHWYILRSFAVDEKRATIALADGWETVRSFPRMRDRGTLRIDWRGEQPRRATLTLRVEDNPTSAEARRRYDREVTAMDAAVGDLMAALEDAGWLDRGLILAFSDHGEDLGEDDHFGHIHHVGPTLTRVPMILWGQGIPASRVDRLAGLLDIAPTLLARIGSPPSPLWDGIDALGLPEGRRLFLETFPPEAERHVRGVIELPFSIVGDVEDGAAGTSAIDVRSGEPARSDARVVALRQAWSRWIEHGTTLPDASPEMQERLRALGYVQ